MGALRTNVIGFDDGPFSREHRGDVPLVGVVCARTRVDGVVMGKVRRDGANATSAIASLLLGSPFDGHVQAVLLQGIAVAGFNVVDIHALAHEVARPVVVVARRAPDLPSIRRALFARVPGAARKWRLIERAGPMERVGAVFVQRAGISVDHVRDLLAATRLHGHLPEALRVAHLIAGAVASGRSRGRA